MLVCVLLSLLILQSKEDDISYLTTESYRPLEYICNGNKSVCDYSVVASTPRYDDVLIPRTLRTAYPLTSGQLKTCTTPDFRKAHRNVNSSSISCTSVTPTTRVMPSNVDAETLLLEVDTYYMTKKNYEEMKGGKITEVIIPINNDEYTKRNTKYRVPLTAVIFHYSPVFGCIIQAPYKTQVMRPQEVQQYMSKMVYMLSGSLLAQSGLYTFTCSGKQPNFVTGLIQRMIVSKSLRLRFVRDPTIIIEGQDGFQITYPPNESGGLFFVNVYTTSELKSFDVVNNDELTSFKISVIFYSYPMFQVVAKYQVKIPKVPRGVTQNYTIHVVNEDNRAASQKIQILMADRMSIHISPSKLEVIEGFIAVFDCNVYGNLIGEVKWSRDYEPLDYDKYTYRMEEETIFPGHMRLRMVLVDVKRNHSGVYICSASNAFETVEKMVDLIAWPNENVFIAKVLLSKTSYSDSTRRTVIVDVSQFRGDFSTVPPYLGLGVLSMGIISAVLCSALATVITPIIIHFISSYNRRNQVKKKR